jgi:hypothetical protein
MPVTPYKVSSGGSGSTSTLEELNGKNLVTLENAITNIIKNVETDVINQTVTAGKKWRIKNVWGTGNGDATFKLYINSTREWEGRRNWTNRNVNGTIEIEAIAGDTVKLTVEHNCDTNLDFEGQITIYELTP